MARRGRGRGGHSRGRARGVAGWAASLAGGGGGGNGSTVGAPAAPAAVPDDEEISAALTLEQLRTYEAAILASTREHEEKLASLQERYKRVRAKMYRDHKKEVIAQDNSALQRFQAGCPKPKVGATKAELSAQADCLQREAQEVDDSDLGMLMRRHLTAPVAPPPGACEPFRQLELRQVSARARSCLARVGDARWTAEGLADAPAAGAAPPADSNASASACGRRWLGTSEVRCLLGGKDILFVGNSVVRRQMYTVLDLLAGPRAHRQLTNFTDVQLPSHDAAAIARSWVWDQDNMTRGYHAAQLFTVDLATGEHRFHLPHRELCGLSDSHSVFSSGRMHQWRVPGSGGGSEELSTSWQRTKWAGREWKPLVSFRLGGDEDARRPAAGCSARTILWAGSHANGTAYVGPPQQSAVVAPGGRRRRAASPDALGARVRARLLREVETFFSSAHGAGQPAAAKGAGDIDDVREWIRNVSVHFESPPPGGRGSTAMPITRGWRHSGVAPNVWILFPTYHGERETFNGFCEDKACECTGKLASCHRHPECRNKHVCKPMPPGSAVFVRRARQFVAALVARGKLLGSTVSSVRLTPFYDDCWEGRGRCQGMRPCREPVDQQWTCRATAMLCVGRTWPQALADAKRWIPPSHPSASLLYLFDGQTSELIDETFRTWNPHTVGYGSSALIFGPQFGAFHGASSWHATLGGIRAALRAADACLGRRTLQLFRSPAFNFDPVNTPRQQAAFSRSMRPIVEEHGMLYVDNYPATYDAVFQSTPHAVKFAKNSAFHYLNNGRYLMAQMLLHALRLLTPAASTGATPPAIG